MAGGVYREIMTILIVLAGFVAAIAAASGYVAWRDHRNRGSIVDPSTSRDALVEADRQGLQGRLASEGMPVFRVLGTSRGSSHRENLF
jgi:uncharacterized iron-regulated membrane protein